MPLNSSKSPMNKKHAFQSRNQQKVQTQSQMDYTNASIISQNSSKNALNGQKMNTFATINSQTQSNMSPVDKLQSYRQHNQFQTIPTSASIDEYNDDQTTLQNSNFKLLNSSTPQKYQNNVSINNHGNNSAVQQIYNQIVKGDANSYPENQTPQKFKLNLNSIQSTTIGQRVNNINNSVINNQSSTGKHGYTSDISPQSDEIESKLFKQFESFKQIDDLVSKQEELYNQIANYQHKSQDGNQQQNKLINQDNQSNAYQDCDLMNPQIVSRSPQKLLPQNPLVLINHQPALSETKLNMKQSKQTKTRNITQTNYSNFTPAPYPNTISSIPYDNIHHTQNSMSLDTKTDNSNINQNQKVLLQSSLSSSSQNDNQSIQSKSFQQIMKNSNSGHKKDKAGSSAAIMYNQHEMQVMNQLLAMNNINNSNSSNFNYNYFNQFGNFQQNITGSQDFTNSQNNWIDDGIDLNQIDFYEEQQKLLRQNFQNSQSQAKTHRARASEVTDRLLTIGKLYEAKKAKMRQDQDTRKREQITQFEEEIRSKCRIKEKRINFPRNVETLIKPTSQCQIPKIIRKFRILLEKSGRQTY
eukprot:403332126